MKNFEIVLDSALKRCNDEFVCDQAFKMDFQNYIHLLLKIYQDILTVLI